MQHCHKFPVMFTPKWV